MISLLEAIRARHSVRRYHPQPLAAEAVEALRSRINEINAQSGLHIQLVINEPKAFTGLLAYGKFSGVCNYLVMAGKSGKQLDEQVGYYGEQLVLLAQQLGLNSCWAGLSYRRIAGTYTLQPGEKVACYIALGYGLTPGVSRKSKTVQQLSNASDRTPPWFAEAVQAAALAPTAINQQKFHFEYLQPQAAGEWPRVVARRGFSLVGYTEMDLGIARLHFEIGAAPHRFEWG